MASAFVLINSKVGSEEAVLEGLKSIPSVKEVKIVYGNYDIVCHIETKSMADLRNLLVEKIRRMDTVESTVTLLVVQTART
jgi:DNA-binding Lrp family transcriptional regulator